MTPPLLTEAALARADAALADTDAMLAARYPGGPGRRQPAHTVYVPADRYSPGLPAAWGAEALALSEANGGLEALARRLGVPDAVAVPLAERVAAKLATEPIEDLRIDVEDGYGARADAVEDADVVAAATHLAQAHRDGVAPSFTGLRIKCPEAATRRRGLRSLDLFVATLLDRLGTLPDGFVFTFPKVSTASQVAMVAGVCDDLEAAAGLATGTLRFEVQVETPQVILGPDGVAPVAAAITAGAGRVSALHYGTYDYSASVLVAAEHQALDHPAADHAKAVMQVAAAGTGVTLSDGSTNVLPVGGPDAVHAAWALHHRLVTRSLRRGFYQGWDLHPGHLPTRFLATFAFYSEGFDRAAERLRVYLAGAPGGVTGGVMDEPATARALAGYLARGLDCGAVGEAELSAACGLGADDVRRLARPRSEMPLPQTKTPRSDG